MAAITQVQLPDGNSYAITDKYALQLKNGAAEYRTSSLKSNDDLNNYTTPGTYICTEQSISETLSNCPMTYGFKLIVMQVRSVGTYCQIIIPYYLSGDDSYIWYRAYNGSSWGSWHKLITDATLATTARDGIMTSAQVTTLNQAWTLGACTNITSSNVVNEPYNGDFDNFMTPGIYAFTNAAATNATNSATKPASVGGRLVVSATIGGNYKIQIWLPYNTGNMGWRCYRSINGTWSWTSWYYVAITDNYVAKTGDTMTGNLNVTNSGGAWTEIKNTTNDYAIDVWASSNRVGLYNNTTGKTSWIAYSDSSGNNYFNGLANSATSDADGNNIADTYVNKSGDTMTGLLTIERTTSNYLDVKNNNSTTTGSAVVRCYNNKGYGGVYAESNGFGIWVNSGLGYSGASEYLVRSSANGKYLFGRSVTTGSKGMIRGIVVSSVAPTTSELHNGDIWFRY